PGDEAGEAAGFNDAGLVVGTSIDVVPMGTLVFFFERAVQWWHGAAIELETLVQSGPPLELRNGIDVDSAGRILGIGRDASLGVLRSFLLENGVLTDLGALDASGGVLASDLNELLQVAGTAGAAGGRDHAFLWEAGALVDLHAAGGVPGVTS